MVNSSKSIDFEEGLKWVLIIAAGGLLAVAIEVAVSQMLNARAIDAF